MCSVEVLFASSYKMMVTECDRFKVGYFLGVGMVTTKSQRLTSSLESP